MFSYLLENYPEIPLHASTQMTVHNLDGVKQLEKLGFSRVVLSRELSIDEIKYIRENTNIELEVFIHGALCISYSGQCLLSSMIGSRSGNRGSCAQPCRLNYDLIEKNPLTSKIKKLDSGFLMSPKDIMGIEYLPELIKLGVNSLKIEGRMKTPLYVGTVTKIYRKYIDIVYKNLNLNNIKIKEIILSELNKKNKETGLSDYEELMQVFNRGGFSSGHLNSLANKNLIYKEKSNNMGLYLGNISNINNAKGYLTLNLKNEVSILDKISINDYIYNVSELMIKNNNVGTAVSGQNATIGRMKGNIKKGDCIYKIESSKLNNYFVDNINNNKKSKKIKINGEIVIKQNKPITFKIWSDEGFYKGLEYITTTSIFPQKALNSPITKESVLKQITKTGNTEFDINNINIELDNNLFVPNSMLNDIKRNTLLGLENLVISKYSHNLKFKENLIKNNSFHSEKLENKKISLLLNIINLKYNYDFLKNIQNLYIPLKYFINKNYEEILMKFTNTCNTYIYMPNIFKDKFIKTIDFQNKINNYKIKGFIVSHISQIELLSKYNIKDLELIGNYTLNIFNFYGIEF